MVKYINKKPTYTFRSYRSMLERCTLKSHHAYKRYSKLGICIKWLKSYENFYNDMGERPKGTTLDRINNNKGYSKKNCRWATKKEQSRNLITNNIIEYNGIKLTLIEWSEKIGIKAKTLSRRLVVGWPIEKALTQPLQIQNHRRL